MWSTEPTRTALVTLLRRKVPSLRVFRLTVPELLPDLRLLVELRAFAQRTDTGVLGIAPGYYLLRRSKVVARDASTPTASGFQAGLAAGLGGGLLAWALGKPPRDTLEDSMIAARDTYAEVVAQHAYASLAPAIDRLEVRAPERRRAPPPRQSTERDTTAVSARRALLAGACALLGVGPDASRAQFKNAFRARARQHHRDLHGGATDGEMAALNAAREIYERHRGWR
ncbi:MAG: hypothetical protein EP330_18935 [Deltaproteobacteria bacterium]|nr:MAG: hypothetical protein EP330_18935 [Deltaproteobacteria bacterium]